MTCKWSFPVASFILLTCSNEAFSQNEVTFYGLIDQGLTFTSNAGGKTQLQASSSNSRGNRWGMTGTESLGGGVKFMFNLDGSFNGMNGQFSSNGTLFGRQVYMGVISDRFGTLTVGRHFPTGVDFVGPLSSAGADWGVPAAGFAAHPGDFDNLNGTYRTNNSLKYESLRVNGVKLGATYAFGGMAGGVTQDQVYALGISYEHAGFTTEGSYTYARRPNVSLFGRNPGGNRDRVNVANPIFSGYVTAASLEIAALAIKYRIGNTSLAGIYTQVRFNRLGSEAVRDRVGPDYRGDQVFHTAEINIKHNVTPAILVGASYAFTKGRSVLGKRGAAYHQVNAGGEYMLSKRTGFYAFVAAQRASGTDSTGESAVAAIRSDAPSSGSQQIVSMVGLRHQF